MTPIQAAHVPCTSAAPATSASNNVAAGGSANATGSTAFKQLMADGPQQVDSTRQASDRAIQQLATHRAEPSDVLSALHKADLSFRTMMQIRDQLVQAYQEIQNIRI